MSGSGFPAGSPLERMFHLTVEERAVIAYELAQAIQDRGSATVDDFENGIERVNSNDEMFLARLHGGPQDGTEIRMPAEFADFIAVPLPKRPITPEDADAIQMGEPVSIPMARHEYQRREGTPRPGRGGNADFDYVGSHDEP